ncbi:MAG: hypothetical protein LAO22_07860 [Acidobacteriia bacterium]|nr:hypothetical protein [Terriglobia bacterium]
MMKKIANPQDEQMVRSYVQQLQEHAYDSIEQELDPSLRTDDLRENLTTMSRLLPIQEPKSVKVIGYQVVHHPDSSRTTTITLEYEFSNQWLLAELVREQRGNENAVTGFHLIPLAESVEDHNRFTLAGKGSGQYGVLLLALAALIISIYGFISCLRTPMGRKKWLWAVICLFGIGRIAVNWTTGAIGFTPIWFGILSAGAVMVPLYSPWIVYASFPVGTTLFLIWRSRLTRARTVSGTPETSAAPSGIQG